MVAPYSPRARPGVSVSFPVARDSLDEVSPEDFTVRNAARLPGDADPWAAASGVSSLACSYLEADLSGRVAQETFRHTVTCRM